MFDDRPESTPVPEWIVTYGDMMSLLLSFFIMTFAIGDVTASEKFRTMIESIRSRFDRDAPMVDIPGEFKPRDSTLAQLIATGRGERTKVLAGRPFQGSADSSSGQAEKARSRAQTTRILFNDASTELDETAKSTLRQFARKVANDGYHIEVRGFLSGINPIANSDLRQDFGSAFSRCQLAVQFLVRDLGVAEDRFCIAVAEPYGTGSKIRKPIGNSHVDLIVAEDSAAK